MAKVYLAALLLFASVVLLHVTEGRGESPRPGEFFPPLPGIGIDTILRAGDSHSPAQFDVYSTYRFPERAPMLAIAQANGGNTSVLFCTVESLPYAYFHNGCCVWADGKGAFKFRDKCSVVYSTTSSRDGLTLSFGVIPSDTGPTTLQVDPASFIKQAAFSTAAILTEPSCGTTEASTIHGMRVIQQIANTADGKSRLRYLEAGQGDGFYLSQTWTTDAEQAALIFPDLTLEQLQKAGLAVSVDTSDPGPHGVLFSPPLSGTAVDLSRNTEIRAALEAFADLVHGRVHASVLLWGAASQEIETAGRIALTFTTTPSDHERIMALVASKIHTAGVDTWSFASAPATDASTAYQRVCEDANVVAQIGRILPPEAFPAFAARWLATDLEFDTYETERWNKYLSNIVRLTGVSDVSNEQLCGVATKCLELSGVARKSSEELLAWRIAPEEFSRDLGSGGPLVQQLSAALSGSLKPEAAKQVLVSAGHPN